jgi:hypothetical protein
MYISLRDIDRLVREGGEVSINHWAYDIVGERLEKTGFRRKGEIFIPIVCSSYKNERGDRVVVTTQRTGNPVTIVKSTLASPEKPSPRG